MTETPEKGQSPRVGVRLGVIVLLLAAAGCTAMRPDPAVMDSLAEMEIRMRLLQSELNDVRQALAEREDRRDARAGSEQALQNRLDDLQQGLADLPERLAQMCPELPASATVNTQCEATPEVQRVVVSGDKLVVGQEERVWLEPPGRFLVAHVSASAEQSRIHTEAVVDFERDGNRWVRFDITDGEESLTLERPLKRSARVDGERRPVVSLRVQLGDVRETVEFALMPLSEDNRPLLLGRNFLTDVALVDVARKYVQPAFEAPAGAEAPAGR